MRPTNITSTNSRLSPRQQAASTSAPISSPAEAIGLAQVIMDMVESADRLLGSIAELVIDSADATVSLADLDRIQGILDGQLAVLAQRLANASHGRRSLFSGEHANIKAMLGIPPNVISLSVPRLNLEVLGLADCVDIRVTIETLSLSGSREMMEFRDLEPVFRRSLAKVFNANPDSPAPPESSPSAIPAIHQLLTGLMDNDLAASSNSYCRLRIPAIYSMGA